MYPTTYDCHWVVSRQYSDAPWGEIPLRTPPPVAVTPVSPTSHPARAIMPLAQTERVARYLKSDLYTNDTQEHPQNLVASFNFPVGSFSQTH
jgi:hypothetical protein